jgi:hypothetical protein
VVNWAAVVGQQTGYNGSWVLGLHATGLRGLSSSVFRENFQFSVAPTYDVDTYRESTTATGAELAQQPWQVAGRLVGRLIRGLASTARYQPALEPPATR